jgi:murein DD-endopeptidase MepM/ murein hydrolase activator NlpD
MNALEQINSLIAQGANKPQNGRQSVEAQEALQKAAKQFEAILLMQLTSALNGTNDDDEDSLFGSDGGSSLAKQMFSEQMATTMADSGGIGLADMIMQKFGVDPAKAFSGKSDGLAKMMTAVKDIQDNASPARRGEKNNASPFINRSARPAPIPVETFTGDANEPTIVSTYADRLAEQANDTTISPLFREEKAYAATRPRRVNQPVAAADGPQASLLPADSFPAAGSQAVTYNFPVRGRISSGFGNRFHPIDKMTKFHAGLDIAVPKNTRVDATAEGVVTFAEQKGGYGNLVVIRHPDGKESRYGHLEKILVGVGDTVSARQQIAFSGSTGKSTGPHLHFEIRENGHVVNPLKFLSNVLPKSADR